MNMIHRRRRSLIAVMVGAALAIPMMWAPAEAAHRRTYRDPEDSKGNLDVVRITGTRLHTAHHGLVFRTTLGMQDEWLDQDLYIEFYFREIGARLPRSCGDDCSGDYAGWLYYDDEEQRIRASGFELINCGCIDVEWPVGRPDGRSVWFDIPRSSLYPGTTGYEIEFIAKSMRQAEPASLPVCVLECRDDVGPLIFSTSGKH